MKLVIIFAFMSSTLLANNLREVFTSKAIDSICRDSMEFTSSTRREKLKFIKFFAEKVFFVSIDKNNQSEILIYDQSSDSEYSFRRRGRVVDLIVRENKAFILYATKFEVVDIRTLKLLETFKTLPTNYSMKKYGYAQGFELVADKLFIAHGERGIAIFNLLTSEFDRIFFPEVNQPAPGHRSKVTDIVFDGQYLFVSYDNITNGPRNSRAFEGVAVLEKSSLNTIKRIPVKQSLEAYSEPRLTLDGPNLIVTNWFLNFVHDKKKLINKSKYMLPKKRIWSYPGGKIVGRGLIQDNVIYGCFFDHKSGDLTSGFLEL